MNGLKLCQWLKKSGTGDAKLRVAQDVVRANKDASTEDVIQALRAAGITPATVEKAKRIVVKGRWDHGDDPKRDDLPKTDLDQALTADPEPPPTPVVIPALREMVPGAEPTVGLKPVKK